MTIKEIALAFSNGQFKQTLPYIAENVIWTIIEENEFIGRDAVIKNCGQVGNYFKSVTTNFKTINVIAEDSKVVINGTAEFIKNGKTLSFVSACDLYEFDENNLLTRITSYCIEKKLING